MSRTLHRGALGRLMLDARTARGLSLRDLATALDISHAHLSNVERGITAPSEALVGRICDALGVPAQDRDVWYAAAEMLAPGMLDALLARPETWDSVRRWCK